MSLKKYNPHLVDKFVVKIPIRTHKFTGLGENGYYTNVAMERPKHVVVLHELKPETLSKFRDLTDIKVHDFSVSSNRYSNYHLG